MELTFLGVGSAYNTAWLNSNALFWHENSLVLLDCGESTFGELMAHGYLGNCKSNIYVILSHLHADHAGSLPSLCSYSISHLGKKVQVVYPGSEVETFLSLTGIPAEHYDHLTELGDTLPGVTQRAISTQHIPGYPSYGHWITCKEDSFYFSGDSCDIPPEVLDALMNDSIGCVYHDVEYNEMEKINGCHLQYQKLLRLVPKEKRGRVCCMHMNCDYRDRAAADGFRTAMPLQR